MGRSRYAANDVVDGHYTTWEDPASRNPYGPDLLDGVNTFDHIIQGGERLDVIAHKYYGDEDYWWIIALANRIMDPFTLEVGRRLRIPSEAKSIMDKLPR